MEKKYVNHENKHIAGRACYNMALACEANGKILLAIDWIKKSTINLNNKKAANYLLALKKKNKNKKFLNNN